jgi:small GTP-binding protein
MTFTPVQRSRWHEDTVKLIDDVIRFTEDARGMETVRHRDSFSVRPLREISTQLERPVLIFVGGEFNAGKSALINAFAGTTVTIEGVTPTTEELIEINIGDVVCIDSPGLNSVMTFHQERAREALSHCDVVLFVTSVERPLSDSELRFLRQAKEQWLREVVVVVNKTDLRSEVENREIGRFVEEGVHQAIDSRIPLFFVSARTGAGIEELKRYIEARYNSEDAELVKCAAALQGMLCFLRERANELQTVQASCKDRIAAGEAQIAVRSQQLLREASCTKMVAHLVDQEFSKIKEGALPEFVRTHPQGFFAFFRRMIVTPAYAEECLLSWDKTLEGGLRLVEVMIAEYLHQSLKGHSEDFMGELSLGEIRYLFSEQVALPPGRNAEYFTTWFRSFATKRRWYRYVTGIPILLSIAASVGVGFTYSLGIGVSFFVFSAGVSLVALIRGLVDERRKLARDLTSYIEDSREKVIESLSTRMAQVTKVYLGRIERALAERLLSVKQLMNDSTNAISRASNLSRAVDQLLDEITVDRRGSEMTRVEFDGSVDLATAAS